MIIRAGQPWDFGPARGGYHYITMEQAVIMSVGDSIMASYKPKKMGKLKTYKAAGQGVGSIKPKVKPIKIKSHKIKP